MKKVAVTGAGGFVGKKLVARLEGNKDIEVVTFDAEMNSLFIPGTLKNLVSNADIIYHLAAVNNPKEAGILKTNIFGTLGILEAVRRYAPNSRFIFVSSFAVYKEPLSGINIKENHIILPRNKYGFTKLVGEKLCLLYSKIFDINTTILRISNIYGPGIPPFKHSVIATIVEQIKNGESIRVTGNGEQTRDFVYIDDVVEAMILAGLIKDRFVVMNICSGEETSINRLIYLISKRLNKKVNVSYERLSDKEGRWRGSNLKAKRKLGWVPRVSLTEGLKKML